MQCAQLRDHTCALPWRPHCWDGTARLSLGVTQVSAGAAGGGDATVLQDGVEVGGCAGLSGRERLHGGEDQGQAVGYVFIWGTSQSRRVACRGSRGEVLHRFCMEAWTSLVLCHRNTSHSSIPSSSTAMTAAPRLSSTCTTVARPFLAAM